MYVAGMGSKGWVAGAAIANSGLFERDSSGAFFQLGYQHPEIQAVAFDPRHPARIYLAAGNGLIRSDDGGRHWRVTTSWDMTELRAVAVDPLEPDHIYVALPDGVGVSRDAGATWAHKDAGLRRRYTHTVQVDRTRAGRVFRGGETGIYLSIDGAETWQAVSAEAIETTDIRQSPADPQFWLASTQKSGLWASHDGGLHWSRVAAVDGALTLYNVAFDPLDARRLATCGWGVGVQVSEDSGRTWQRRTAQLPSGQIWRVEWDPDHAGRLYASVHEEALYQSDDAGRSWTKAGLDGSIVYGFAFVPQPESTFDLRKQEIIERHAARDESGAYQTIAAKLYLKQPCDWCSARLIELLKNPQGDMFWMMPVSEIAYLDQGQLSDAARAALRRSWLNYMPYRGDTENHWLLYYAPLYLMAQKWPGQPGSAWFNGKSSEENYREAEGWIRHWMDLTLERGQGEYDSTHYIVMFLIPLSELAAWSDDPAMRQRARMMIEYIVADFAAESLGGIYVGAHARTDDRMVREKWAGVSSDLAWLFFGQGYPLAGFSGYTTYYLVASGYEPPAVISAMATTRDDCYLHREKKRTRNRWRYNDERNGDVYKTTYVCPDYAVSSDQGGILQPIQQHSWDVTWALADPRGKENTLFALHPYSSTFELQTYFTFMKDFGTEAVVRSKKSYDSPDKFLGGSPFEQVAQDRDSIVALYDIPAGTRFEHINAFFSKDLTSVEADPGGWIFARGGASYIAFRPLAPYEWKPLEGGGRRLYSPHLKNGVVMQVAAARELPSFDDFKTRVRALELSFTLAPVPALRFRTLRGHLLECTYGRAPVLDGKAIDYATWPPFDGPFIEQRQGSRRVLFHAGGQSRVLDFDALTAQ